MHDVDVEADVVSVGEADVVAVVEADVVAVVEADAIISTEFHGNEVAFVESKLPNPCPRPPKWSFIAGGLMVCSHCAVISCCEPDLRPGKQCLFKSFRWRSVFCCRRALFIVSTILSEKFLFASPLQRNRMIDQKIICYWMKMVTS